jgi:hypothetical protein
MKCIKYLASLASTFLFSTSLFAAGAYDGIWMLNTDSSDSQAYITLVEKNGTLVVIYTDLENTSEGLETEHRWSAYSGVMNSNSAEVSTIVNELRNDGNRKQNSVLKFEFSSSTNGSMTVEECTRYDPEANNGIPTTCDGIGAVYSLTKIW